MPIYNNVIKCDIARAKSVDVGAVKELIQPSRGHIDSVELWLCFSFLLLTALQKTKEKKRQSIFNVVDRMEL